MNLFKLETKCKFTDANANLNYLTRTVKTP